MKPSFKINDSEKFWQDANANAEKEINEIRAQTEKRAKKKKRKIGAVITLSSLLLIVLSVLFAVILLPQLRYNKALSLIKEEKYDQAIEIFVSLGDYKDSADRVFRTKYDLALRLYGEEKYDEAYTFFDGLGDYRDSQGLKKECIYKSGLSLLNSGKWAEAKEKLSSLNNYKDAGKNIKECDYQLGLIAIKGEDWEKAVNIFSSLADYKDSEEQLILSNYNKAKEMHKAGKYTEAVKIFEELSDFEDSKELKLVSMYAYVKGHQKADDMTTFDYLKELTEKNFEDSKDIYKSLYAWSAKCVINNSKSDSKTNMEVVSRFDTVYFHVSLSGGAPNATTTVKYEIVFPGGSIQKGDFGKDWKKGSEGCTWVWFKSPAYADTGYAYIKLFDLDGRLIGEDSVYIAK